MELGGRGIVLGPLYYPSSENKGADQLRGYRAADLRLCFRICRTFVFFTTRLKNAKFNGCKNDNFQLYFFFFFSSVFKHRLWVHILTRSDTNQAAQSATGDG